ncbi:DctP family TRAP transporter solute-binding subunit [Virgibacillus sp. W0181]|uniref:DctP family TRAP transporter solute-binding subunit n=1 Tax=Virgibacillus sp. W0181 TaxID=3391581 RepID=UPI003F45E0EC
MRTYFKFTFSAIALIIIVIMVSACGSGNSEDASSSENNGDSSNESSEAESPSIEMTIAHAEAGDESNYIHASAVAFKEYVETESANKITVNISPGGALGDADSMMQQAMAGTLEVAGSIADGSLVSVDPDMLIWSIPYLFENEEQALSVYHGSFGESMWESFTEKTDLIPLVTMSGGLRMITNNKHPIKVPDDLNGLQIRTMNMPAHMEFFNTLGATPTPISWNELYAALQTGVVDGQENGIPSTVMGNLYEVQDYLSLNGYVWTQDTFLISKKWFDQQPADYQKIIMEGGEIAEKAGQERAFGMTEEGFDILKEEVEIYEPTQEEMKMFKEAVQEPVSEFIKKEVDNPDLVDELLDEVENAS